MRADRDEPAGAQSSLHSFNRFDASSRIANAHVYLLAMRDEVSRENVTL